VYAFIKINQDEQGFRRSVHDTLAKTFEGYGRNNEKTESVDAMQSWVSAPVPTDFFFMFTNMLSTNFTLTQLTVTARFLFGSIAAILTDRMDITIKPFQTVVVRKRFVLVSSTN
jgi:hypothetical protein